MILQLNPSIPVYVPSRDKTGEALFILDYGKEDHTLWAVAFDDTGEVWWLPNPEIRLMHNPSIGRMIK